MHLHLRERDLTPAAKLLDKGKTGLERVNQFLKSTPVCILAQNKTGWFRVGAIQWVSVTVLSVLDSKWDHGDSKRTAHGIAPIGCGIL